MLFIPIYTEREKHSNIEVEPQDESGKSYDLLLNEEVR